MSKNSKFWKIYEYVRNTIQKYFCKRCGKYYLNESDKEDCLAYLEDIFLKRWDKFDKSRGASQKTFINVVLSNAEKDFCKKKRYTKNGEIGFYLTINIENYQTSEDDKTSMDNSILDYFSKINSEDIEKEVINKITIERIFSKLSKDEILLLVLKYIDGYKSKEIAELFNTNKKNIDKKIEQIKKKVKKLFHNESRYE